MPYKKKPAINYTSRDFNTIKGDLLEYVKRYYSDIYKDFNEASFGSLVVDTVSYIGDILSFYLDYQANESFMESAIEYDNVLKHARTLGYKYSNSYSATGTCTFYIIVPSRLDVNAPDYSYLPILQKGTLLSTNSGTTFTLTEDVDFSDPNNEVVVASVDEDPNSRAPTFFGVRAFGNVISGELAQYTQEVSGFQRFLKVDLPGENISEILSVTDSSGNEYHQVDHLSQNTIFKSLPNKGANYDSVASILKSVAVPRRYIVEHLEDSTYIQFGYGSESEMVSTSYSDPSSIIMRVHGKDYVETPNFDPKNLTSTDKFGIAPADTILKIVYRINNSQNANTATRAINNVVEPKLFFKNRPTLRDDMVDVVTTSIQVENEEPIVGDITAPKSDEVRRRAADTFATQSRAVTRQDYKSSVYLMPSNFGAVKRCSVYRDNNDLKRNLNIYVVSEDSDNNLVRSNQVIKNNLRTWLNSVRMITDSVDIKDAKVLNIGIKFRAAVSRDADKQKILKESIEALKEKFAIHPEIGESLMVTDIFKCLKDVEGIVDVLNTRVITKTGELYAETSSQGYLSSDGRVFSVPFDTIWEIKNPDIDIEGVLI